MKLFLASALLLAFSSTAFAVKLPVLNSAIGPRTLQIPSTFTTSYDFEGIVALNNCSGSLIQLDGMNDSSKALVLTNGHCVEGGFTEPGKVNYKIPSSRRFTLLKTDSSNAGQVFATELLYSTMTNTDMAIYKLNETYGVIKARFGINPLRLESVHPALDEKIEVISGYWKRGYACGVESFIFNLKEDRWLWQDSLRYSRPGCETIGGTSGSPIVRAGTKTVIGVNNTGNEDGQRCAMNNPCEITEGGDVSYTMGYSYGQQTFWVYSCVTATNDIDLTKAGCLLPH